MSMIRWSIVSTEKKNLKQIRKLTQFLMISVGGNILLLALFFYWLIKERPPTPYCEKKPADREAQQLPLAIEQSNSEIIRSFRLLSFNQLVGKLTNTQLVENGYTQRDLALACLIAFHHFDLARALNEPLQSLQQRKIQFGIKENKKPTEIIIYAGLTDPQFKAIIHFAKTERWPQTSKGLYSLITASAKPPESSLADAFYLTPEFLSVETLFNRAEKRIEKQELLKFLSQGNWSILSDFADKQRIAQDLSPACRQHLLLQYIKIKSKAAAYLFLKTDGPFAAHKLDDAHVILILNLLDEKTPESEQFALSLLTSPRSDAVWKMAANRLYDYRGIPRPEKFQYSAALSLFAPQYSPVLQQETPIVQEMKTAPVLLQQKTEKLKAIKSSPSSLNPPPALPPKKDRLYVVQEGDSLWKIAKRFKVDIQVLRTKNRLSSDFLKPGTTLLIP